MPAQVSLLATASLFGLVAVLSSLEGLLALALRAEPIAASSEVWRRARREYYMRYERRIVQYLPECARFDPELAYRLKPGTCRFANREYDVGLDINSAGLRDREDALAAPGIVVAGDSFAMGWGVAQPETLPALLGELTGEKTLNTAEPSYGTVRELLLLRQLDLSAAHALVIQYCENDFVENGRFLQADRRLATMSRAEYEALVADHRATTRYWPGKHLRHFAPLLWRSLRGDDFATGWVRHCEVEARAFLNVLRALPPRADPLRVVAFEAFYTAQQRSCFGAELARLARDPAWLPDWISALDVIDAAELLDASDYYPLDEHWNASGHRKLAHAVADLLRSESR